ncbi:hypothetical protein ZIOFF_017313 [Zingiber officinale]|uniref:Uncharacterized protein n=1 Tax=Zingiber officinale TaxID=94328 RepID=A0A8J5LP52_ZINOF|nr:hypothetical protein ZIOFF_017313 [Zingiber officinale]
MSPSTPGAQSPDLHLVGHLGDLHLAAATLANSWGTVTGFALMVGLSGALETLCSQAYDAMLYKIAHTHLASPGAPSGKHGRLLSLVPDPRPLRLCTPIVHAEGAGTPGTPGTGGVNGTGGRSDGVGGGRAEGMDSGEKGIGGRIDGSGGKVMGGKGGKKVKLLAA